MKKLVSILVGLSFSFSIFALQIYENNLNESNFTVNYSTWGDNIDVVMEESLQGFKFYTSSTSSITVIVYYFKSNNIMMDTVTPIINGWYNEVYVNNIIRFKIINDDGNTTSGISLENLDTEMELPLDSAAIYQLGYDQGLSDCGGTKTSELKTTEEVDIYISDNWIYYPANGYLEGVYNSTGQKVSMSEDVSDLPTGIYIAKVNVEGGEVSYKFLKQ